MGIRLTRVPTPKYVRAQLQPNPRNIEEEAWRQHRLDRLHPRCRDGPGHRSRQENVPLADGPSGCARVGHWLKPVR